MKVAELLESRRQNWSELEQLCYQLESRRHAKLPSATISRFTSLYRSACADLALADAYQLPANTVEYLHRLVGRAHNQFYRTSFFDVAAWGRLLFVDAPRRIFGDPCVQVAGLAFWIFFLLSAVLAQSSTQWPNFAQEVLGESGIETLEENFAHPPVDRSLEDNQAMAGFYIQHNTGIGLQCFAHGLLVIPGLLVNIYNAVVLGASFGYMWRPEVSQGANFFEFVTAHGPFELTAIVLSSGAGLRLGISWMWTNGLTRSDSLQQNARQSMPLMGAAIVMFFMAALIEGFVSPSPLPYFVKASIAAISSGILMFYFVVLGFPRR